MNATIYSKNIIYFLKCAELKSISKAAKELHISQSALSMAIKRLEEELGFALFSRGRGLGALKLTDSAVRLAEHLKGQKSSVSDLLKEPGSQPNSLKIAAIQYVTRKFLLPALEETDLLDETRVFTVRSAKALEAINSDRIDMAFVLSHSKPLRDPRYCIEIKDETVGIVGLKSKFPQIAKAKSPEELKDLPVIVGDRIRDDWYDSLNDYQRAYYIEDHFSARALILGGYAVAPFQLDYFTVEELKLLAVSKFKIPSTGWKLYAILNRHSAESNLQKCREIVASIKDMVD
ncbi:LysR family transcriptional regulator [Bdellovibrio sp. HCB290]|uniref:LysR family transcriptional regulator n=1 Tax=Bdellovibrio sp. HCB290 TaxID=3394356 RepID=UPI0039B513D6